MSQSVATRFVGRYKAVRLRLSHVTAQNVRRTGATDRWVSVAPCFPYEHGHARHRPKRLAEKLLQIRKTLDLSQKEMAERLENHRTQKHVSKYERAKSIPPIEVVFAYARLANVQMEQIIDDKLDLGLTLSQGELMILSLPLV